MSNLDVVIAAAPFFQKLIPMDSYTMICDTEFTIVQFVPSKTFPFKAEIGGKVAPTGSLAECIRTGKEDQRILPKELYGTTVKATSIPIHDANGKLLGSTCVGLSIDTQEKLHKSSQTIAATSEQMSATAEELATTATSLAQELAGLKIGGENVLAQLEKTESILRFVNEVSSNSNLLGLNAAIEAARAGEHGRGFAVVAEEIRKMAVNSAQAVREIKTILDAIGKETNNMISKISDSAHIGERQAAATEEISASMQQLATSAAEVEKIAEIF